ncbi:MAG: GNAT family N-acetyltransferase [Pseudomonadota bacterium]
MTDQLETERLRLRPLAPKDADAIIAYYQTERSKFTGGHQARFGAWKNTAAMFGHWLLKGFGLWAVTMKGDDTIIGLVGPFFPDGWPEPEIGWVVFESAEGKGIAFEAAQVCIEDARQRLGWAEIVHYIDPENTRSIRLAERLGASLDPNAAVPKPDDPCLVYRQPRKAT